MSQLFCFLPEAKKQPPIIGATCAFDAKIYENADGFLDVSAYCGRNKKFFQISDFSFQLPSLLVDFLEKILPILTLFPVIMRAEFGGGVEKQSRFNASLQMGEDKIRPSEIYLRPLNG
jgi:hypothetical protein